jgi:c(7)-type cytochrome triheme protein
VARLNAITMAKIQAGEYCGACHGKVAFPVEACGRCHAILAGGN